MSSPSITYRQLNANNDPLWGQGQANFLSNQAAVVQAVLTRLKLFQGEWWAATNDGLPLFQSILGQSASARSQDQIAGFITARIQGTPFVISVSNVRTTYVDATRAFGYSATVNTQFGSIVVSNIPQPSGVN